MPKINVKCLCMRVFERERVNKWICLADIVQNNFVWIWLATIANWQPIQWTCFQSWSSVIFMPTCFQLPNSVFLLQRHFCCNVDPQLDSSGNCTFVFCRCRCHSNDKSGRHNSLDQTYFEFSINAYLTLLCAAGSNHISAAYKVPLSLCLCITKLHMSRISFFFLPRCVRSEWTAENVFFFPKVKVMLHMDMQFKTKILFGGNHNRSVLFRCWDQCEMFKCCFYCCSPKNITFLVSFSL